MTQPAHRYCIDTSSLIEAWRFRYPHDAFPSLWNKLDEMVQAGRVISPEEVYEEIKKKDDDLFKWCRSRKDLLFCPLDVVQQLRVRDILREYPKLTDTTRNRSVADPWVIALADIRSCTVITEEGQKKNGPKIPDVCDGVGVRWIKFLALIREERWSF